MSSENSDVENKGILELQLDTALRVNFASAQNNIPILKTLRLLNKSDVPLSDLTVALKFDPPLVQPKSWTVDRIAADAEQVLQDLSVSLDIEKLRGLNETEVGELSMSVFASGDLVAEEKRRIELLAKDHWGGLRDMDRLLAAFVSPNDAVVSEILKTASQLLEQEGHDGSLEGYQSGNPQRAWMIAAAIWSAVTGMSLTYANPPSSFEDEGQKIRSPHQIRSSGLATCLDLSLLMAAAWEAAGLHSAVLFSKGHAFAGVWIVEKDFLQVTEPDVVSVRKAAQAREFVPVETTLATKRPSIGFTDAIEAGAILLSEQREDEFITALDVRRARAARIRPLASHQPQETETRACGRSPLLDEVKFVNSCRLMLQVGHLHRRRTFQRFLS